jgi:hypothetical protein
MQALSLMKAESEPTDSEGIARCANVSTDPVIVLLKQMDLPVTRQNYLRVAYLGEVPDEFGPELEMELPEELRKYPTCSE